MMARSRFARLPRAALLLIQRQMRAARKRRLELMSCCALPCECQFEAKTFTVGGVTFILNPGGDPCGFEEDCCYGDETGSSTARLFWDDPVWQLAIVLDTGSGLATANYSAAGILCSEVVMVDLDSEAGAAFDWPDSIVVVEA